MVYHVKSGVRCRSEPDNFWYTAKRVFCTYWVQEMACTSANSSKSLSTRTVVKKVEELVLTLSNQQVIEQN